MQRNLSEKAPEFKVNTEAQAMETETPLVDAAFAGNKMMVDSIER